MNPWSRAALKREGQRAARWTAAGGTSPKVGCIKVKQEWSGTTARASVATQSEFIPVSIGATGHFRLKKEDKRAPGLESIATGGTSVSGSRPFYVCARTTLLRRLGLGTYEHNSV